MKISRSQAACKAHAIPQLAFESQQLTAFSGLVLLQAFFRTVGLRKILARCFRQADTGAYAGSRLFLMLIVHVMLGFRRLRSLDNYADDPMVKALVGFQQLPAVSTWTERLRHCPPKTIERLGAACRTFVLAELHRHSVARITLDFDGSVLGTRRHAEGVASGFNPQRKGQRSYYPLFCTIAQSAQVLDVLHRGGNVHDSNGANAFMATCIAAAKEQVPGAIVEARMDSAFFSEKIISQLTAQVEYTASVAFMRFDGLKHDVEMRQRWSGIDEEWSYFEKPWRPMSWTADPVRLFIVRRKQKVQQKGALQLELFEPVNHEYQYSVIATNKTGSAEEVIHFHHGRGSQEGLIGELKDQMNIDYVPSRWRTTNELYLWAAVWGHNLYRRLGMNQAVQRDGSDAKRPALWVFEQARTVRESLIHRPGRITSPGNRKLLTLAVSGKLQKKFKSVLESWLEAA